jgi:hypothetical protein
MARLMPAAAMRFPLLAVKGWLNILRPRINVTEQLGR